MGSLHFLILTLSMPSSLVHAAPAINYVGGTLSQVQTAQVQRDWQREGVDRSNCENFEHSVELSS